MVHDDNIDWYSLEQKFYALVNLVRLHPVEELVSQLQTRKIISKEQVIRESKNNYLFLA